MTSNVKSASDPAQHPQQPASHRYRMWHLDLDEELNILAFRGPAIPTESWPFLDGQVDGKGLFDVIRSVLPGDPWKSDISGQLSQYNRANVRMYALNKNAQSNDLLIDVLPLTQPSERSAVYSCSILDTTGATVIGQTFNAEESFLEALMQHSPAMIVIKDVEGRYLHLNKTAEEILGVCESAAVGHLPSEVLAEENAAQCASEDFTVLEQDSVVQVEQHYLEQDGLRIVLASKFPARDDMGCTTGVCTVGLDITKIKRTESKLYAEAHFDHLTEIPNRLLALDRLNQAIVRSRRRPAKITVMVLDLGQFSVVQETLGREIADQILIEAAWRLRSCSRQGDTIAKIGSDRFAIIAHDMDVQDGVKAASEKALSSLRKPFHVANQKVAIAPSAGISIFPDDSESPYELFSFAEIALARAMHNGRNMAQRYEHEFSYEKKLNSKIALLLDQAVLKDEFHLVYQPLIDPYSNQTIGAEALLRWESDELGWVGPDRFIPIAEDSGQIHRIGEWVLRQACCAAFEWNVGLDEGVPVAINVSPKQVIVPGFRTMVEEVLRDVQLDPALLKIEITETAFASDADSFRQTFLELTDMGIRLSLDDFGTGYSSLGYLHSCPFDVIKIDRCFLKAIGHEESSRILLANIIAMAKSLGLQVVAEGVESDEQVRILRDLKCDQLQGYRFSRPLVEERFREFLRQGPLVEAA